MSMDLWRRIFAKNADALFFLVDDHKIVYASPRSATLLGYKTASLVQGARISKFLDAENSSRLNTAIERGKRTRFFLSLAPPEGEPRGVIAVLRPLSRGFALCCTPFAEKNLERLKKEENRQGEATGTLTCPLTSLPQGDFFMEQVSRAMARASRRRFALSRLSESRKSGVTTQSEMAKRTAPEVESQERVGVGVFEINIPKDLERQQKNALLKETADTLQEILWAGDMAGRGKEGTFYIIVENTPSIQAMMEISEKIRTRLLEKKWFSDANDILCGLAFSPDQGMDPRTILRAAQVASNYADSDTPLLVYQEEMEGE